MQQRISRRLEGILVAQSSIKHGGDQAGTITLFRREKVMLADGTTKKLPIISGNMMRGILRDAGIAYMLDFLGLTDNALPLTAHHYLFSGGSLTGQSGRGLDIDLERKLKALLPFIGVIGSAIGNMMEPSRMDVGKVYPICVELAHVIPERFHGAVPAPVRALMQIEEFSRQDDSKDPRKSRYLLTDTRRQLEDARGKARGQIGTEADVDLEDEHQQMRYGYETLALGTRLYWWLNVYDLTPLEFEAFASCLLAWLRRPVIGGRGAAGHGQVRIDLENWFRADVRIGANLQSTGEELGLPMMELYHQHLVSNREAIAALLRSIV